MAYQYEKVNHELLVPQIEDQLMMYMKQENIAIGEKLPSEYKLAELFGVGRSTIREAVKSLVTKGVLEVKRGSGTYVRSTEMVAEDPLGLAQFEDKYRLAMELFEVRILLEPEGATCWMTTLPLWQAGMPRKRRSSISKSCVMRPSGSIWKGRITSPRIWNSMRLLQNAAAIACLRYLFPLYTLR